MTNKTEPVVKSKSKLSSQLSSKRVKDALSICYRCGYQKGETYHPCSVYGKFYGPHYYTAYPNYRLADTVYKILHVGAIESNGVLTLNEKDWPTEEIVGLIELVQAQAISETLKKVREMIGKTPEYMETTDNDSHRYQIPTDKQIDWENFLAIPEDDERSWDVPEWAERIDGMPVTSFKDELLSSLEKLEGREG